MAKDARVSRQAPAVHPDDGHPRRFARTPACRCQDNALTEIETSIVELKELGPATQCLAGELENLLARYDMDGVIAFINRVSARTG